MENTLIVLATIISALAVTGQILILWRQTKIANEQIEMQRQLISLSENEERSKQAQEISTWVHTYEVGKPETHILHGRARMRGVRQTSLLTMPRTARFIM